MDQSAFARAIGAGDGNGLAWGDMQVERGKEGRTLGVGEGNIGEGYFPFERSEILADVVPLCSLRERCRQP